MCTVHFISFLSLDYDNDYIPHLLRHYGQFEAISDFHLILHSAEPRPLAKIASEAVEPRSVFCYEETGTFLGPRKLARLNEVILSFPEDDWVVVADADELIEFPDLDLESLIESSAKIDVYYGRMLDHTTGTGVTKDVDPEPSLFEQFPATEARTESIGGNVLKPVLFRRRRMASAHGLEGFTPGPWSIIATIHHFKWTATTKDKLLKRIADYRGAGLVWWRQSARALKKYYGIDVDEGLDHVS